MSSHRAAVRALVALLVVTPLLSACSGPAAVVKSATVAVSVPAAAPGSVRSSTSTAGITLYLEPPAVVQRGQGLSVRLIVVNTGTVPRHFSHTNRGVKATQTALPDSIGAGDLMKRRGTPRPLDLAPGASTIETITLLGTEGMTPGRHPVSGLFVLESTAPSNRIVLQAGPVQVLFK